MKPKTFLLALSVVVLIGNVSCALFTESSNDPSAPNDIIEEKDIVELAEHIEEIKIESLPAMIPFAVEEASIDIENLKSVHELVQPVPRARNGKLVFVKHLGGGKSDICSISMETEDDEPRRMHICENDYFKDEDKTAYFSFSSPKFSPDGSKIVFSREDLKQDVDTIYTMDQDGQNLRKIVEGKYPCFTPDGQRIVAVNNLFQVFTCDLDGGNKKKLIPKDPNARCEDIIRDINITPDDQIVFLTRRLHKFFISPEIYDHIIADAVTGEIIKIVKDVERASFSPDGKYIVFINWNRKMCISDVESGRIFEDLPAVSVTNVIWSPDGRKIFYSDYSRCGLFDIKFVDGRPVLEQIMERYIFEATQYAWQPLPI